jgi:hypothetical protein
VFGTLGLIKKRKEKRYCVWVYVFGEVAQAPLLILVVHLLLILKNNNNNNNIALMII